MRVPRSFCFVDLSGFTNYTAERGDDAAGRILSTFRSIIREVTSNRGVRVAKWLGDGCMIVAVEQADALAAVLDIEARSADKCAPLTVRAGMATGYALLFEGDDYIGSAVNMAARLCDAAAPFELLMPADQIGEVPEGVIVSEVGTMSLRGFPEPVTVAELSGLVPPSTRNDTGELWTRSPFGV